MYASKPILMLTSMVACALANAVDADALFGAGASIAGVVVRDVNGVERMVDYNQVAHLVPRQAASTVTVFSCSSAVVPSPTPVVPVPLSSANPGGPASSPTSAASAPSAASTTAPAASASSAVASSLSAVSSSAAAASSSIVSAASSSVAAATSSLASASSSAASATAATTSALPTNNVGSAVDANMAAAMVVGFAVAAFV